jgi:hypothetical protein
MGDEADYMSDIGGDLALMDAMEREIEDLILDREYRLRNIVGKHVVVSDGQKIPLYLQDRTVIPNGHYWTKFLANAIPFVDRESAEKACAKLKYNNPRVALVGRDRRLEFLKR